MKSLASVFSVDPDTTIEEPSYESHIETQYHSLRIHPDLMVEQIYLVPQKVSHPFSIQIQNLHLIYYERFIMLYLVSTTHQNTYHNT